MRGARSAYLVVAAMVTAMVTACYVAPNGESNAVEGRAARTPGSGGDGAGATAGPTGLPCAVDALLETHCRDCHRQGGSAPMPLVTYEDVVATGARGSYADRSLVRMKASDSPMPPGGPSVSAEDVAVFEEWVSSGTPRGTCGESATSLTDGGFTAPAAAKLTCSTGAFWTSGKKGTEMNPGLPCVSCHQASAAKRGKLDEEASFVMGGTVYASLHEEDLCVGASLGAKVVVTDAVGKTFVMPVGPTGNFSLSPLLAAPTFPIRAKVVLGNEERVMKAAQMSGDCNACHTAFGEHGAPGRIMVP